MRRIRKFMTMMGSGGGAAVPYLFRAEFSNAVAAPISTPYTADVGAFDIVDSGGRQSITDGELTVAASINSYDPDFKATAGSAIVSKNGTAVVFRVRITNAGGRFVAYLNRDAVPEAVKVMGSSVQVSSQQVDTGTNPGLTYHSYYIVWSETLKYMCMIQDTKLFGVYRALAHVDLRPSLAAYTNTGGLFKADYIRGLDLGAKWATADFITTDYDVAPAPGVELTMEADALIDYQWDWVHGDQHDCYFRRVDDANSLIVRLNKIADTIKVIKVEGGVETELSSAALTTGGYYPYIKIIAVGTSIKVLSRSVLKANITEAFNATATGVKLASYTAGDMPIGIRCWPINIAAPELAELQRLG